MSSSETTIEPLYVVDTHALIWYLTNSQKIGPGAAQVFAAAERGETRLIVSAIVISELYYANRKSSWFADFSEMYAQVRSKPHFRFVDFRADDVLDFDRDATVPEMHDRMIAGLARRLGAPLLTTDSQIKAANLVRVVW